MIFFKNKTKNISKTILFSIGFIITISILSYGTHMVRAAWEEPSAEAPGGNIFVPLNVGPDQQAKQGRLLLDPLYNPTGEMPQLNYPLEVRGTNNAYINNLEIDNDLVVDTDTFYVDGSSHNVGIGTSSPGAKLEIVGGTMNVGTDGAPIAGTALSTSTSGLDDYGAYGISLGSNLASVLGQSTGTDGLGVYGLNVSTGGGIYAESNSVSAVVGTSHGDYDTSTIRAGIYGHGRGLGAWAGYFEQRLFGSDQVIARKFVADRLQNSQIPYTAAWEVRDIEDSIVKASTHVAFDGTNVWLGLTTWYGRLYVFDPVSLSLIEEIAPDPGMTFLGDMMFAGGYVWVLGNFGDAGPAVAKYDPDTHAQLGRYLIDNEDNYITAQNPDGWYTVNSYDMVYDDVTTGGPFIWTVTHIVLDDLPYEWRALRTRTYSITKLNITDGSFQTFRIAEDAFNPDSTGNKCMNYNQTFCTDRLDNDNNDTIDNDGLCVYEAGDFPVLNQVGCEGVWTAGSCVDPNPLCQTNQNDCEVAVCSSTWIFGTCSDPRCTDQATCEGHNYCEDFGGTWTFGEVCSDRTYADQTSCEANGAKWAINTCSNLDCTDSGTCTGDLQCESTWWTSHCESTSCFNESDCINVCNSTWYPAMSGYCEEDITYSDESSCTGAAHTWHSAVDAHCQHNNPVCNDEGACTDPGQCASTWRDGFCSDSRCTPSGEAQCIGSTQCGATGPIDGDGWYDPDLMCGFALPDNFADHANDERIVMDELINPNNLTLDTSIPGNPYLWITFGGQADAGSGWYMGQGYVKIDTTNPEDADNSDNQFVYCSNTNEATGPYIGADPDGIVYDDYNQKIWVAYPGRNYTVAGMARVDPADGSVIQYYDSDDHDLEWGDIKFYDDGINPPSLWRNDSYNLYKYDLTDLVNLPLLRTYRSPSDLYDFTFDTRDTANPFAWTSNGYTGAISRNVMYDTGGGICVGGTQDGNACTRESDCPDGTCRGETDVFIMNGARADDIIFDGSNIWTSNHSTSTISKYRAVDGEKIGDYDVGYDGGAWGPGRLFFDGSSVWISWGNILAKVKASSGESEGVYDIVLSGSTGSGAEIVVFDGQNAWTLHYHGDQIKQTNTTTCGDAVADECQDVNAYYALMPYRATFDGEYIWYSHTNQYETDIDLSDSISGIKVSDGTQVGPFKVLDEELSGNINQIISDGTYLWIGLVYADYYGNSIYKIDPHSCADGVCTVVGKYPIYLDSGRCDDTGDYCTADAQCNVGARCTNGSRTDGLFTNVMDLLFDGTYIWATNIGARDYHNTTECGDGIDNDGDGDIDERTGDGGDCVNDNDRHEGGQCNDGQDNDSDGDIDMDDEDCTDPNTDKSEFDESYAIGQCNDGIDNDGDIYYCDYGGCPGYAGADSDCNSGTYGYDTEFRSGVIIAECADGIDNDGNGTCDWDGAVGSPGCSGKPDFGCAHAGDQSEDTFRNDTHLTRILASTGEIVDSLWYGSYCGSSGLAFDGTNVWMNTGGGCGREVLRQYYSGHSLGSVDLNGVVNLQGIRPETVLIGSSNPGTAQAGGFRITGSASFSARLTVVGDLVVANNTWGGSSDTMGYFGQSCPEGQFAKGVQLGSVHEFGTGGVVTIADGQGDGHNNIHITSDYMYIAGMDDGDISRIEKRRLDTAELCVDNTVCDEEFGTNGVLVDSSSEFIYDMALDTDYMYITEYISGSTIRIEKRRQSNGSLCTDANQCDGTGFGYDSSNVYTGDGVVISAADSNFAKSIAIDSTYMYVIGSQYDGINFDWRIEKRLLTTGELVAGFGTGGVEICDNATRSADKIAIDSTHMYIAGTNESWDGRVEKRLLSTGALEPGFGVGGVIDGMITDNHDMVIDSDYLYVTGRNLTGEWSFEKYRLSNGVACNTANLCADDVFGNDGIVTGENSGNSYSLAIDETYLYVVGSIDPVGADMADWRIERRLLSTGALDTDFGTGGFISGDSGTYIADDIAIDSNYMYVTGNDQLFDWRIEKRNLVSGALNNIPGALECRPL